MNSPAFLRCPRFGSLPPFELDGRQHSVSRVLALGIAEHLDVVEHVLPGLPARAVAASPDPFALKQVEEALGPGLLQHLGLPLIFLGPLAQRRFQPCIEATWLDAQASAHGPHGDLSAMRGDERGSHSLPGRRLLANDEGMHRWRNTRWPLSAKQSPGLFCDPARFRMSRSSATRASSRFNRRISASFPASPEEACANFFFQAWSACWLTPRRSETSLTGSPAR